MTYYLFCLPVPAALSRGRIVSLEELIPGPGGFCASVSYTHLDVYKRQVINDQIPKSILDLLQTETRHYVIDRLKFIGASVKKPIISEICQIVGVEVNILGATVQEFGESIMCIFILQMFGSDDKLLQAEAQIDAAGVLRERVVFG